MCQLLPFLSLDTASAVDFRNDAFSSEISPSLPSGRGTKLFTAVLWMSFAALLYPHLAAIDDKDAMAYMIPLISGEEMQTLGTAYLRARTCIIPKYVPYLIVMKVNEYLILHLQISTSSPAAVLVGRQRGRQHGAGYARAGVCCEIRRRAVGPSGRRGRVYFAL